MIDLGYFREHLDQVEQMLRNRGAKLDLSEFRAIDAERRRRITSVERLKAERNKGSEEIARLKKAGQDAGALMAHMKQIAEEIKADDAKATELEEKVRAFMLNVPNIRPTSVPVGASAAQNVAVRGRGASPKFDSQRKTRRASVETRGSVDLE